MSPARALRNGAPPPFGSAAARPASVVIPSLRSRRGELERIVREYEGEAVQRLGVDAVELTPAQRSWVRERCGETLPEIQRATLRLIAIRHTGSIAGAAALLRMSRTALGEWLKRRRGPSVVGAATAAS